MMKVALFAVLVAVALAANVPAKFDAREEWTQCAFFILNQEECGSCWDFCSMESLSDRLCINGDAPSGTCVSPEPVLECSKQGCDGGFPSTAWQWVIDNGNSVCTEQCFSGCVPYDSGSGTSPKCHSGLCDDGSKWETVYHAESFESLSGLRNHDLNLYQTELMTNGPLQACFTVFNNFYTFFSLHPKGTYTQASGPNLGGHCVKMVGWGTDDNGVDYWLFANSWDTTWADGGYFKMARGVNLCGIEGQVSEGFTKSQAKRLGKSKGIHPNVRATEKPVGAWTQQSNPAEDIFTQAAEAGLKQVSEKMGRTFTLRSVLSSETQVVAGVNFKIVAQTVEGEVLSMRIHRNLKMAFELRHHELSF